MTRILSIAAAFATSALLLVSASGAHAQSAGLYTATPVAQPGKTSFLTRETMWNWRDGAYVARRGHERDVVMCTLVAQRAGKLSAFAIDGAAVAPDMLDKCNAKVK